MASQSTTRKYREIRDVYNKLRQKYRSDVTCDFIEQNYFVSTNSVYDILPKADKQPVTEPSVIYTLAMSDDFKL